MAFIIEQAFDENQNNTILIGCGEWVYSLTIHEWIRMHHDMRDVYIFVIEMTNSEKFKYFHT